MKVTLLRVGKYKEIEEGLHDVDCSVTLVEFGKFNILYDTGGAWALSELLESLATSGLSATDITHVIGSHGHSDHIGCLSAFPHAFHFIGGDANLRNNYSTLESSDSSSVDTARFFRNEMFTGGKFHHWGANGIPLDDPRGKYGSIRLVKTPGHTSQCTSLLLEHQDGGIVLDGTSFSRIAIVGDLWDCVDDEDYYRTISQLPLVQEESRSFVLKWGPDCIIPGHGAPFAPSDLG
ncbi:hypothetical protein H310_05833 [Aphanomyces invadans]|uniref:Metallo-beta-lactamase domain-containing protein 1 n=1 Tax=Aphanomyces invadans TaxID=157072 RepID=A0A024U7T8_9STRA|nr:hypothetical protein H310_05833 [Aphanomyces invadans]ETW02285.1 hypothetical protein H310_05833 [Aphanomyces invadans]|eukprot:XP_008868890.1 hypothetical protein H310_05833 [Aphanomyces invadans]